MFTLMCARINGWANNHEAGDLRRYRAHYDVIIMTFQFSQHHCNTTIPSSYYDASKAMTDLLMHAIWIYVTWKCICNCARFLNQKDKYVAHKRIMPHRINRWHPVLWAPKHPYECFADADYYDPVRRLRSFDLVRQWVSTSHDIIICNFPDSKVHGANMGPTWALSAPAGPMLAPWTLLSGFLPMHAPGIWMRFITDEDCDETETTINLHSGGPF